VAPERPHPERPFLVYRDGGGADAMVELPDGCDRFTIGRRLGNGLTIGWDPKVSRVHAALERVGQDWVLVDEGLSSNGTFLNAERVLSRRRLADGDVIGVGRTTLVFSDPGEASASTLTEADLDPRIVAELTRTQREVLIALCRPFRSSAVAGPATNREIAEELSTSVDAVKSALRGLFSLYGLDGLPQNQKRARLALEVMRSGVVTRRDL
jgi:pSer/pThr/pTyr-binding forkhead associated (FHA) protein